MFEKTFQKFGTPSSAAGIDELRDTPDPAECEGTKNMASRAANREDCAAATVDERA